MEEVSQKQEVSYNETSSPTNHPWEQPIQEIRKDTQSIIIAVVIAALFVFISSQMELAGTRKFDREFYNDIIKENSILKNEIADLKNRVNNLEEVSFTQKDFLYFQMKNSWLNF